MKCSQPSEAEMRGLNRIEKRLMRLDHATLVGMFEESLNQLAHVYKVKRQLVWRLLFEELKNGKN